ncbi:hypothetical protein [Duganella violaceipulchra]|uniref:DUF3142 domain-containing protein n=1 Tax=Duganella violaceipulchra TaxID=2849652 RepID=A0AA41L9Y5_9BURK|nr:hypothetical protein [Duganella violaceicalia]MBV6323710.1 hypothetical protein [Duganella violaceicalia]MCP2007393.1 hypothetical protein [Duganella violaceicalia]
MPSFLLRLAMCALLLCHCAARAQAVAWLWDEALLPAWSQPEAAVLHRHILLSGDTARTRPRMRQPAMPAATRVTPVLHVEVSTVNPPRDIEASRAMIVRALLDAAADSTSGWVQLDMEAKPSQREFYRLLVKQLRGALSPQIKLSVTALAWWCRSPAWLDGLAADEVVPMFFRMGRDSASMRDIVEQSPATLHASCRAGSAGFSPQEPFTPQVAARYRKTYWFDRHAWKRAGADLSPLSRSSP